MIVQNAYIYQCNVDNRSLSSYIHVSSWQNRYELKYTGFWGSFEHCYSSKESYVILHIIHLYISTLLQMSQCNFPGVATKRYNNTELVQVTHHAACQNWSRCRSICARNSSCAAFSFVNTGNICIMSNISDIVYIKGLTHRSNVLVKKPISEQMAIYNITRVSAPGNGIYKQQF